MNRYIYGQIKFFTEEKGYGFITCAPDPEGEDKKEIFFHIKRVNGIPKTELVEGLQVKFQTDEGRDGREMAVDVQYAD